MLTTPTLNPPPTPTAPTPPRVQDESPPGHLVTEPAAQATGAQFPLFLLTYRTPQLPSHSQPLSLSCAVMWEGSCPLKCFKIKSRGHLILPTVEQGAAKHRVQAWPPELSPCHLASVPPTPHPHTEGPLPTNYSPMLENESFPGSTVIKHLPVKAGGSRSNTGLMPGSGRSPGIGNGNQIQYSA